MVEIHPRALEVNASKTRLRVMISEFQEEYGLSDIEILQALADHMQTVLRYMLRRERHPEDPDKGADEA